MSEFDDELDAALAEVAVAFVEEARELLEEFESLLLEIDDGKEADDEHVNAIFRAMHSIKGSAGMFGFDNIVEFTHVVENVLSKWRNGAIDVSPDLIAILLRSCDHTKERVELASNGINKISDEMRSTGEEIHLKLNAFLAGDSESKAMSEPSPSGNTAPDKLGGVTDASGLVAADFPPQIEAWHLSLRFSPTVLQEGMDPVPFVRFLGTLGKIISTSMTTQGLPDPEKFNPEICYIGFEIDFVGDVSAEEILQVFDFVKEDSIIEVLPPNSSIVDFAQLFDKLPESDDWLAMLLSCSGAINDDDWSQYKSARKKAQKAAQKPLEEGTADKSKSERDLKDNAPEQPAKPQPEKEPTSTVAAAKSSAPVKKEGASVRVDAEKLDRLINVVGELVIAGAGTVTIADQIANELLNERLTMVSRLVHEIRDSALSLRMVEIGATFDRFKRVVRDVSKELDKKIALKITGGETELDKSMVEQIADPLMHLVRNSIDHGIESAELRAERGKPEHGKIELRAYHDSGSIVIEIRDDGGGLNTEKIRQIAVKRELIREDDSLSDREIHRLVFAPGFSTAEKVTSISGRGVGMDVVKSKIDKLRGTVDVMSKGGEGSAFILRLPLTLAIIDGFLVRVGKDTFVMPLDMVVECIELPGRSDILDSDHTYLMHHGKALPYVCLRDLFRTKAEPAKRESIVVVRYAGQIAGLVVDELLGEYQTVIKPMGRIFEPLRWTSGSTILGDGSVGLILDAAALIEFVIEQDNNRQTDQLTG